MIPNELYLKILPGKKLNTLESLGDDLYIDAIFCDSDNAKIAALSKDYPLAGLDKANVTSDTTTNIYVADDSHTVKITTPVVQGMFKEVYVDTSSDPVRVHIIIG